jgi:hypothetical protein
MKKEELLTVKEIIKLVVNTRHYSKEQMLELTDTLYFFDAVNYLIWVKKLLDIDVSL